MELFPVNQRQALHSVLPSLFHHALQLPHVLLCIADKNLPAPLKRKIQFLRQAVHHPVARHTKA